MGSFCGSYSGISHMSAWATQMSIHDGQCSQRFRGDCGTGQRWWGGVIWGLGLVLLALTHRSACSCIWVLGGGGVKVTCCQTPPPFPNIFMQVRKRAALKGKMLGGTTTGKPRSLGRGDTCLGGTVGAPQRICNQLLGPRLPWAAILP